MTARRAFAVAVAAYVLVVLVAALLLPDTVPIHFSPTGADRYTSRGGALVAMLVVGGAMLWMFWGLAAGAPRLPMSMLNIRNRDWWTAKPQRVSYLRRMLRRELYVLGTGVFVFATCVFALVVRAAGMAEPSIQPWAWVLMLLFLAFIGWWLLRLRRLLRPEG